MDLAQFKSRYIKQIKALYSDKVIYPEYPVFKQQNIDGQRCGYVAQDKTDMDDFISGKVTDISGLEADINSLSDTEMYDDFPAEGESEATLKAYVASYLSSCTTDEMQLICLMALRDIKAFY